MAAIAEIAKVRRDAVYRWLDGETIPEKAATRLERIVAMLADNQRTSLAELYRYWHLPLDIDFSIGDLLMADDLNRRAIRFALRQIGILSKQQAIHDGIAITEWSPKAMSRQRFSEAFVG